jgi:hypothetical protein
MAAQAKLRQHLGFIPAAMARAMVAAGHAEV